MHTQAMAFSLVLGCGLLPLGAAGLGCSGGSVSVCGNGRVEKGEDCDCGTNPDNLPPGCHAVNDGPNSSCSGQCRLRAVVVNEVRIHWTVNGQSILGEGSFDTCNDVGATYIRIRLVGPNGYLKEREGQSCGDYVASFTDDLLGERLLPGEYSVFLEIQDTVSAPLAPVADETFFLAAGANNVVWVDFPLESFYNYANMEGSLLYRLHWGEMGARCVDTEPLLATQIVVLSQDGEPLAGYPQTGPCSDSTTTVTGLAPGDYHLRVEGYDGTSALRRCLDAPVKVGAGVQPAYQLVVPTLDASSCE